MLSEDERTGMYHQYKNIVYYIARRHDYLDTEIDDIIGWGFVGFVVALNKYEKSLQESKRGINEEGSKEQENALSFTTIAFPIIKREIFDQYRKRPVKGSIISLSMDGDDSGRSLEETIADKERINFSEKDIAVLLNEALANEDEINRKIAIDFFLKEKTISDISKEVKKPLAYVTRTTRRGQAIIKKHLVNNDIILEDVGNESHTDKRKKTKISTFRPIIERDYGKIKYIRKNYPYLMDNQIALFLQVSSHSLSDLFNHPTVGYRKAGMDETIELEIHEFSRTLYPEYIPSDVKIIKAKVLQGVGVE